MSSCTTLTVEEDFSAGDVYVSGLTASPATVSPGESFEARAEVTNNNPVAVRATIDFTMNGDPFGTRNIVIEANTTDTWPVSMTAPNSVSNYSLCAETVSETPY